MSRASDIVGRFPVTEMAELLREVLGAVTDEDKLLVLSESLTLAEAEELMAIIIQ